MIVEMREGTRQFIAYNPRVEGFGRALRLLRGYRKVKVPSMARRALGEDATTKAVDYFANYIRRMEREEKGLTNPGLDVLLRLARGLEFNTGWEFLERIEAIHAGLKNAKERVATSLTQPPLPGTPSSTGVTDGEDRSVHHDQLALSELRAVLAQLSDTLADLAAGPPPESHRSLSAPRAPTAKRR